MSFGNIVGSFVRDQAASFSTFVCEKASSVNQMAGEAFTNPSKLIEEVNAGASYALSNKVYELAASSSIILGAGITGLVLAKKAYSSKERLVTKLALGATSLVFLSAAAYETYARVSELRLTGRCIEYASIYKAHGGSYSENNWSNYENFGCPSLTGRFVQIVTA